MRSYSQPGRVRFDTYSEKFIGNSSRCAKVNPHARGSYATLCKRTSENAVKEKLDDPAAEEALQQLALKPLLELAAD